MIFDRRENVKCADAEIHAFVDLFQNKVRGKPEYARHRVNFSLLVLSIYQENRKDKVFGTDRCFLDHVANDLAFPVAARPAVHYIFKHGFLFEGQSYKFANTKKGGY